MPLTISAGVASDVGRVRSVNEDAWCLQPRVYAVADGMGGHTAGDRASQLAVESLGRLATLPGFGVADVQRSLAEANAAMVRESSSDPGERSMGTTVAGVAVVAIAGSDHWLAFNIGDSRIYELTDDRKMRQISVDHSEVQEMIDSGAISPEGAAHHPLRNVVTRSLGSQNLVPADTWLLPMTDGQVILICSDGLTGELSEDEIAAVLATGQPPEDVAQVLVAAAVAAGGHDNVTALVLHASSEGRQDDDTRPMSIVTTHDLAPEEGA